MFAFVCAQIPEVFRVTVRSRNRQSVLPASVHSAQRLLRPQHISSRYQMGTLQFSSGIIYLEVGSEPTS